MGLLKLAVFTAVGVYSYRSVQRINQLVKPIRVPKESLLYHQCHDHKYMDAFKAELPREFKLLKGTDSDKAIRVHTLVRAFYSCPVFSNFEGPLLRVLLQCPKPNLENKKFDQGESCYLWRVEKRNDNEILMQWGFRDDVALGTTWFLIPKEENCIVFGSSLNLPNDCKNKKAIKHNREKSKGAKELFIEASRNLTTKSDDSIVKRLKRVSRHFLVDLRIIANSEESIFQRLKRVTLRFLVTISLPIHRLYSKYLLASTLKKLISN